MLQALRSPLDDLLQFNPFKPQSRQSSKSPYISYNLSKLDKQRQKQREHEAKMYEKQIRPPRQANPHSAIPTSKPFETASVRKCRLDMLRWGLTLLTPVLGTRYASRRTCYLSCPRC